MDLDFLNPCGVEDREDTYCRYKLECTELGRVTGGHVCLSRAGYDVADHARAGSVAAERPHVFAHLREASGRLYVDPTRDWQPMELTSENIEKVAEEIVFRAGVYANAVR